ncbi:hypothetical protein MGYG_07555 [Nannizzia gypsea CBS 118893]|uniref:Uncharacterized protein n=1 Tax=Arthroderma gypseum (strain ATCC MYA-4604 / CBS 118893) TaxID=535722 RepID=E4V3H6_ARTGP|nr:hypothetical protein MGYG_07555 [Nannizzia gypsea CBS 118893]EFR04550.1 hypothetical protein MGYG_07555 [Nannizzia gypsea CBS 118893]
MNLERPAFKTPEQKTEDLEVKCIDGTRDKVNFPTTPELLKAIGKCERVTYPEKRLGLPSNGGFSGFIETGVFQVFKEFPVVKYSELHGPVFSKIRDLLYQSYPRMMGQRIYYVETNHWVCITVDLTGGVDPKQSQDDPKSYLLRSELLEVFSIFYCQMNEMTWNSRIEKYKPTFRYKEGFLMATVMTFMYGKVRVIQASLKPSETYPVLTFTLRGIYDLNAEKYDKEVAYTLIQWILSPPKPAEVD